MKTIKEPLRHSTEHKSVIAATGFGMLACAAGGVLACYSWAESR